MVSNPSLTYIGHITDGSPDPNANYKKVKSSGQLDYRKLHKLSQKPRSRIKIELATVNYIKDVIDESIIRLFSAIPLTPRLFDIWVQKLTGWISRVIVTTVPWLTLTSSHGRSTGPP